MIHISPYSLLPVLAVWLLFMIAALRANLSWFRMYRAVASNEFSAWYRNPREWHRRVVEEFCLKIEHESDPGRRAKMESLLRTWRTHYRACTLLLVAFLVTIVVVFFATVIRAAA